MQVDGLYDLTIEDSCSSNTDPSIRYANFSFNQKKQTRAIQDDARLPDYDVTVNNHDENATIKCSPGFYLQVVKPCFFSLNKESIISSSNIVITISDMKSTYEKGDHEVNRKIKFTFKNQLENLGGVTVHLHHSSRTIQIQGSYTMPNKEKAALWFTKVTVKRLKEQAAAKQFLIKECNEAILQASSVQQQEIPKHNDAKCENCNSIFNTQSRPSACGSCSQFVHRKCIKQHSKACKNIREYRPQKEIRSTIELPAQNTLPLSSVIPASNVVASLLSPPNSTIQSDYVSPSEPGISANIHCNSVNDHNAPIPALTFPDGILARNTNLHTSSTIESSSQREPMIVNVPPLAEVQTSSLAARSTPLSTNNPRMNVPPSSPTTNASKNRSRKKQVGARAPQPPTDQNNVDTTLLNRELAAAQARISELDTQVADKDNRISILRARVKCLEEKANEQVYERYFGGANQDHSSRGRQDDICSHDRPASSSHHCHCMKNIQPCIHQCPVLPSYCSSTQVTCTNKDYLGIVEEIKQLRGETKDLKGLVTQIINASNAVNNKADHAAIDPHHEPSIDQPPELIPESIDTEIPIDAPPDHMMNISVSDSSMTSIDSSILNECPLNLN